MNHKETRMVKDGEDKHGLQMIHQLKNLGSIFQDEQTVM